MRIALVSPYSWSYPGGVTRHIEALAESLIATGHSVTVLTPYDPADALSVRLHGGARPQERELADYVVPLGRTFGIRSNGSVSNVSVTPTAGARLRRALREGNFDVVHVHEPNAGVVSWVACQTSQAPLVGTFHAFSENKLTQGFGNLLGMRRMTNRINLRIAVSEAASWTGKRFYGGNYRIIPNGVDLHDDHQELIDETGNVPYAFSAERPMRLAFLGQAVERKGLPVLLRSFEALREHVPCELSVIGASEGDVEPLVDSLDQITVHGKVSDRAKHELLEEADVLVAPSLGGESFGMVLTEAFAAGTPVVASNIAGYRDVLRNGTDGLLVRRGDALDLAETLRDLWHEPARIETMRAAAIKRAERFSWSTVTGEIESAYGDAIAARAEVVAEGDFYKLHGFAPADGLPPVLADRKLASLEPELVAPAKQQTRRRVLRRAGIALATVLAVGLTVLAVDKVGADNIWHALVGSSPPWVLAGLVLMCASMVVRAVAWDAILKAALPKSRLRLTDALQGTFIGVLMSATLPARAGELSRALIVARRSGRARENLPTVLGTLVAQVALNILALIVLGIFTLTAVDPFGGDHTTVILVSLAPLVIVALVLLAPVVLRGVGRARSNAVRNAITVARDAFARARDGLRVFRQPRLASVAIGAQMLAWLIQLFACYALLVAFGIEDETGIAAAAAVLFITNVTAALPATPSNIGVFQAACVAVLAGGFGVATADALGYGIVLQAVEIATAFIMGAPALLREGLSWRDVKMRALHSEPVRLKPRASDEAPAAQVAQT